MPNPIKLKPCPFCGGKATMREYSNGHKGNGEFTASYKVGCEKCQIYFLRESRFVLENGYPKFIVNGYETATGLWNTRPVPEEKEGIFDEI